MSKPSIPRLGAQHDTELDIDLDERETSERETKARQRHNRIARRYEAALDPIILHAARHERIGDMDPLTAKVLEAEYGITDGRARQAIQRALPGLVRSWNAGDHEGARRQAQELADSFADAWPDGLGEQEGQDPAALAAMVPRG